MTTGEALVAVIGLIGFFATLAGFVVFAAAVANDLVYRWERRRAAQHPRREPEVAQPCAIYPLEFARSRRAQQHDRDWKPAA